MNSIYLSIKFCWKLHVSRYSFRVCETFFEAKSDSLLNRFTPCMEHSFNLLMDAKNFVEDSERFSHYVLELCALNQQEA